MREDISRKTTEALPVTLEKKQLYYFKLLKTEK